MPESQKPESMKPQLLKRWLREPLVHFVLLGAALFVLQAIVSEDGNGKAGTDIVVDQGRIENLATLFAKTWQRPPSADELRALVNDHVLEEALYREGVAMGLDRDDTIIRRRVRQKVEFMMDDLGDQAEATDAELETFLAQNAEAYVAPASYSFRQVYLSPDRRGDHIDADANRLLLELRSEGAPKAQDMGDSSLLEHTFADTASDVVARTFGQVFAGRLAELAIAEWSGPVESAYGQHLVIVDERVEERVQVLAEVRDQVERDWRYAQREEVANRFSEEILARYRVTVDWPEELAAKAPTDANSSDDQLASAKQ